MCAEHLVSVMMATYNRAHLLPRAIRSVLNQTYNNFELIVVDDGSTDDTPVVVKSFDDNRIIYHKHSQNRGLFAARNTGFDLAKGTYGCCVDSDDEIMPEALEIAVNKLVELAPQGIRMVSFDCLNAETAKLSGYGIRQEGLITYEDYLCGRVGGNYWTILCMDLLGDSRFDERMWRGPSILWLKLFRKSSAYYTPRILYKAYVKHGERTSSRTYQLGHLSKAILKEKAFIHEFGEEAKHLCPKRYGRMLATLGSFQVFNDEKAEGRKALWKSFEFDFSLKFAILYLLSFVLRKSHILSLYTLYLKILHVE